MGCVYVGAQAPLQLGDYPIIHASNQIAKLDDSLLKPVYNAFKPLNVIRYTRKYHLAWKDPVRCAASIPAFPTPHQIYSPSKIQHTLDTPVIPYSPTDGTAPRNSIATPIQLNAVEIAAHITQRIRPPIVVRSQPESSPHSNPLAILIAGCLNNLKPCICSRKVSSKWRRSLVGQESGAEAHFCAVCRARGWAAYFIWCSYECARRTIKLASHLQGLWNKLTISRGGAQSVCVNYVVFPRWKWLQRIGLHILSVCCVQPCRRPVFRYSAGYSRLSSAQFLMVDPSCVSMFSRSRVFHQCRVHSKTPFPQHFLYSRFLLFGPGSLRDVVFLLD